MDLRGLTGIPSSTEEDGAYSNGTANGEGAVPNATPSVKSNGCATGTHTSDLSDDSPAQTNGAAADEEEADLDGDSAATKKKKKKSKGRVRRNFLTVGMGG